MAGRVRDSAKRREVRVSPRGFRDESAVAGVDADLGAAAWYAYKEDDNTYLTFAILNGNVGYSGSG